MLRRKDLMDIINNESLSLSEKKSQIRRVTQPGMTRSNALELAFDLQIKDPVMRRVSLEQSANIQRILRLK